MPAQLRCSGWAVARALHTEQHCWFSSLVPTHGVHSFGPRTCLPCTKQSLKLFKVLGNSDQRQLYMIYKDTCPSISLYNIWVTEQNMSLHFTFFSILHILFSCCKPLCIQAFFQVSCYNVWTPDFIEEESKFPFGIMKYNRINNFCCNNEFLPKFPLCIKCITEF